MRQPRPHNRQPTDRRFDPAMKAIMALIAAIAIWLLAMPLVPAIASATLRRFHLRSDSFAAWAIQFPIPAMYNFANRYYVADRPPQSDALPTDQCRMLNHFPSRIVTFADGRYTYLKERQDRWFQVESSYRGQTLRTCYHAKVRDDGGYDLVRVKPESTP